MNYHSLKAMFPHILFHADRVSAFNRRNQVVNKAKDGAMNSFLATFEPSQPMFVGTVQTASWDHYKNDH